MQDEQELSASIEASIAMTGSMILSLVWTLLVSTLLFGLTG